MEILIWVMVFLYGITIGSFLNVCIYRIPAKESIVAPRSHCMKCGYILKWYDLVPLFSYLFLGGRCRKCRDKISFQYPLVEFLNGLMYLWVFFVNGINVESVIYCLAVSALVALSVIDFRTYEIPFGFNIFITVLGAIHLAFDYENWLEYVIGFFAVSLFLLLLNLFSNGRAMGGGDVKLMAAAGFLIGWKLIVLAFFIGCILGSIIHVIRMKLSDEGHGLAFGPYLSAGIVICMLYGNQMIDWYISICHR